MDARESSIVAQVAAKVAGDICSGSADPTLYLTTVETVHNDLIDRIASSASTPSAPVPPVAAPTAPTPGAPIAVAPEAQAVQVVQAAFPGATAAIHADSPMDELLADAAAHPENWNFYPDSPKSSCNGGTSPDMRHKTIKKGNYGLGVWLVDKKFGKHAPHNMWQSLGFTAQLQARIADGTLA